MAEKNNKNPIRKFKQGSSNRLKENLMSRIIMMVCLILLLMPNTLHANSDLSEILDSIRKKYGALPGLCLSYEREVITKTMTMLGDQVKGDQASGKMFFKPLYFFRLEQETPDPETIVSDGDHIWWSIPDQNRVYRYPADEFGIELRLLSDIFHGLVEIEERFQVALLDSVESNDRQIELTPDPPLQNIERILLTVSDERDIRIVSIHYQLGSLTRFTLHGITEKNDYPKDFFNFSVPEGTLLIEETADPE